MTSRKQGVLLNGQCSSWIDIRAGLPQGSIVGDLLFLKALRQLLWRKLLWWKNHLDWQTCLISMFSKFFSPYEHVWQHYLESILEFQNRFMLKFRNLQNQQTYTRRILKFHYIICCVSIVDELRRNSRKSSLPLFQWIDRTSLQQLKISCQFVFRNHFSHDTYREFRGRRSFFQ